MAIRFFHRDYKTVNLVFSDHAIRFIELKQRSPVVVQQFGERLIDHGIIKDGRIIDKQLLKLILEAMIDEWGIKKRHVRFIVPDSTIVIRKLSIPKDIHDDEVNAYLFLEIGTSIHLPFVEPIFDVFSLHNNSGHKEVLLVATEEEGVQSYLTILKEVGLKPDVADISPLSLYRLYHSENLIQENDHVMLLHFDRTLLTISIFHQHVPLFMRPTSMLEENEDVIIAKKDTLSTHTDMTIHFVEILKDIIQVMSFYQFNIHKGEQQVNRILLSGDQPELPKMKEYLMNNLEIEVGQLTLHDVITTAGNQVPESYSLPLGLSLKEVH